MNEFYEFIIYGHLLHCRILQIEKSVLMNSFVENLHMTFMMSVSSRAEFGNLGLNPSHLSFVPSSFGKGRKVNVETTFPPSVELVICEQDRAESRRKRRRNMIVILCAFA